MAGFVEKLKSAEVALSFDDVLLLPRYSDVKIDDIDTSTRLTPKLKLSIPVLSSPMDTVTGREIALALGKMGGLGVLPRNMPVDEIVKIIRECVEENIPVATGVGPFDDERVARFLDAGVSLIVIDTAHGHSKNVIEATRRYASLGASVMAGNIVTGEAAEDLISAGAVSLRVGVGPGHACTTREIAGVGCPQLTAIATVADVAKKYGVSVVADGGIEKPSDAVKSLAAGADAVMLGYLLAGTDEAPGALVINGEKCYKIYRGMGSKGALTSGSARYGEFKRVPEGVEGLVECRGSAREVLEWIVGGIKQGMGYVGAKSIRELQEKSVFVRLTNTGVKESGPRGLLGVKY